MSIRDPLSLLPHREPFRFVTGITDLEPGESASGYWTLGADAPFLAGHFPGRPIVPGVLIAEALAQVAGIAMFSDGRGRRCPATVARLDLRFRRQVEPPARILLRARLERAVGALCMVAVEAAVGEQMVADGSVVLADEPQRSEPP